MRKFVPLVLLLGASSALQASELSWEACVEETRRSNGALLSARESLAASRHRVSAGYAPFFPRTSANLSYSRGNSGTARAGDVLISGTDRIRDSYAATIDFSQNLFAGFSDAGSLLEAKAAEAQAQAAYDAARAQASHDLKLAFSGLKYAQEALTLAQAITQRRSNNLRLVELRFQGGRENKGSYLLSKAAFSQARYEELQARQSIQLARRELARVLGRDEAQNLQVTGEIPLLPAPSEPEEMDFSALALSTPAYLQALAQTESADAQLLRARSGFFPSLNLSGSIGRLDDRFFPENERWSVGLAVSFPFFRGGGDYFATKSAAANVAAANENQLNSVRKLLSGLEEAYTAWLLSAQKIGVDREFLEAATVRSEIARNRYNNGLLSFEDWDLIENDLIQRQKIALQSARERVAAEARWELASGQGVIQ